MEYRGYLVEPMGSFPMVKVRSKGSGSLPNALKGTYTTYSQANRAIDAYLNSLKKGKPNGKTKGISTG